MARTSYTTSKQFLSLIRHIGWTKGKTADPKFAKSEHIITAYEINVHGTRKIRGMKKLTDQHVYPDQIKRQTCKLANQIFSANVTSEIQSLAGGAGKICAKNLSLPKKMFFY